MKHDRYLEHAIACLNRAKDQAKDGVICELSAVEVDMILDLLKEQDSIDANFVEMKLINGDSMFLNTKYITAYRYLKDRDETVVSGLSEPAPVHFPGDQTAKIRNAFNYINKDGR